MKKTYNINIASCAFVIDEDAYDILDSYLQTLGEICGRAGQRETATDIEERIAEVLGEKCAAGPRIISRADVEEVIARMGAPEEIVDVDVRSVPPGPGAPGGPGAVPPPPFGGPGRGYKKLYRDVDNKVLGGVCSGLAWYLNIDVVWVRIAMVLLAFLTGSTVVLIYLVLWFVIPPARSPYERMQMMGMNPSMRNVGRVVTADTREWAPKRTPDPLYGTSDTARSVGRVVIIILLVVGLLLAGTLLAALSIGFVGCLIAICVAHPGDYAELVSTKLILGIVMGGSLVAGIPLFLLFRWLLEALTQRRFMRLTPQQRLCLIIPWVLGAAACIVCGILLGNLS